MADVPQFLERLADAWQDPALFPPEFGAAAAYARGMHGRPLDYYLRRIRKLGLRGSRVLDAGCGTGTWSFALAASFQEVVGVDYNDERSRLANWIAKECGVRNTHFARGDITDLGLKDESFDHIFCYGVVLALPIRQVLRECFRILKPGGVLYVCLNGIGWSMYLRDGRRGGKPSDAAMGLDGIYNTLCQQNLSQVRQFLVNLSSSSLWGVQRELGGLVKAGVGRRIEKWVASRIGVESRLRSLHNRIRGWLGLTQRRDVLREAYIREWDRVCETLGNLEGLLETMQAIRRECGEAYVQLLARDLESLASGRHTDFSHSSGARGYDPEEVEGCSEETGFIGYQWAHEGMIIAAPSVDPVQPVHEGTYNGHHKVWEMMAFKPEDRLGLELSPAWFIRQAELVRGESLYAPRHRPLMTNVNKDSLSSFRVADAARMADAAGGTEFVRTLAQRIVKGLSSQEHRATALTQFVQGALCHHPLVQPLWNNGTAVLDPATLLFLHIGRCGAAARLLTAMLHEVGIEARVWQLPEHVLTIAVVDGREVVLEADYYKGGLMLRDESGRLLAKKDLLENPNVADQMPSAIGWEVASGQRRRDLWGRPVLGYVEDPAHIRIYSSYFTDPTKTKYLPTIPEAQALRRGAEVFVQWSSATSVDNEPIAYELYVGSESRGWNYERAQADGRTYYRNPGGKLIMCRTAECSATVKAQGVYPAYVSVRPYLVNRPEVFCWPSEEVRVS